MNGVSLPASSLRLTGIGEETPVYFPAGEESLFGILGTPARQPIGVAVIVLPGGWKSTSAGRNRVLVRLCRRLVAAGHHTFRFDYLGMGESTGVRERFALWEPSVDDLKAAVEWLRTQGLTQFVLVGFCFGAWTALSCAPQIRGLRGLAMVAGPLDVKAPFAYVRVARHVKLRGLVRQAFRPWFVRQILQADRRRLYGRYLMTKWDMLLHRVPQSQRGSDQADVRGASTEFLELLGSIVARRVPMLMLYGTEDFEYGDFQRARSGALAEVLSAGASSLDVRTIHGDLHGLADIEVQDALIEMVTDWLSRQAPGAGMDREDRVGLRPH